MDPHDHLGLLLHRHRHTAAIAIAVVGDDHVAGLPGVPIQAFPAAAIRDMDLRHATCQEVIGQMQSPVIPGPARLVETAGVHQQEAPNRVGAGGRGGRGEQLAQQPEQPGIPAAQALAPGRLRDVRQPAQHGPRPEPAGR
jgi:hypothetical protein